MLREWSLVRWVVAAVMAVVIALAIGIPSGLIHTPWYSRMTPTVWWNYPTWLATAVLGGLISATYIQARTVPRVEKKLWATVGSALAVGCPVCNKVVVAVVGVGGALTVWAPLQPILAFVSVALLGWALQRRLQGERLCAVAV
ncbi:hypothetical protein [Gordonia malaquae]|uniref:hypothetical protein n=1 Tax=Gordonia malaquae TaxID=410332 RepID=UPI0030174BD3